MRKRRILLAAVFLVLSAGIVAVTWTALDWPPPGLILKYGPSPEGGPTGQTKLVGGIEFAEISPGAYRFNLRCLGADGDLLGRIGSTIGLPVGKPPWYVVNGTFGPGVRWVEVPNAFWLSTTALSAEELMLPANGRPKAGSFETCIALALGELARFTEGSFRLADREELLYACGFPEFSDLDRTFYPDPRRSMVLARSLEVSLSPSSRYPLLSTAGLRPAGGYRLVWIPPEGE